MHTDYLNPVIRQLRDQQVRFAPREKQIEQTDSAERLLNELDPKRTYTWEYVCHRVTNNGFESNPDLKFTGEDVTSRFGLRRGQEPLTLKQMGAAMGVTKERSRQIPVRAMNKLRMAAEVDRIECPV
jgi:hypothetical protein